MAQAARQRPEPKPTRQDELLDEAVRARSNGNIAKAEALLRRAMKRDSSNPHLLHFAGLLARDRGRPDRALQLFEKARDAGTDAPEILCDLGLAYKAAGRAEDAILCQGRVTELLPNVAFAWSNLGAALNAADRTGDAIVAYERALKLAPKDAEIHFNLANTHLRANDPEAAINGYRKALDHAPDHRGAIANLASALKEMGQFDEAYTLLTEAVAATPGNADALWNLSLLQLMQGDYTEGWANYEARRAITGFAIRPQKAPDWDGGPLNGKRLLVHAEQGLGDTIQFCRYLSLLPSSDKADIIFEAPARMIPLLQSLKANVTFHPASTKAGRIDCQAPLMSLPHLTGQTDPNRLKSAPYLSAEPDRITHWRERLATDNTTRRDIAICWQGNPDYRADRARSIPLTTFATLAARPDIRLISLQQDAAQSGRQDNILALGSEIDRDGAFLDSAAILKITGLLITSDTAIAHLGGALGIETWLALAHVPDWRWGIAGETTPWYPNMKLFRQPSPGDWDSVFDAINRELGKCTA